MQALSVALLLIGTFHTIASGTFDFLAFCLLNIALWTIYPARREHA
jgi:hypothetical protein